MFHFVFCILSFVPYALYSVFCTQVLLVAPRAQTVFLPTAGPVTEQQPAHRLKTQMHSAQHAATQMMQPLLGCIF